MDIDAYLSRVSTTFRKFVLDTLVKLGIISQSIMCKVNQLIVDSMEDTAPIASGRPPLKSSSSWNNGLASPEVAAPSGGEEALRILENLKRSKSFRSPAPATLTSSDDASTSTTNK